MTDSVWWYVLAGFLLGFILSTLWEWLYFRRQRMRIENGRIAELEATVRSLSTVSQSAEVNTSPGFAAGYQSPMVFLEGEEDDVDTVEVIVPAPPEPVDFDQSIASQAVPVEQQRSDTQFVAARSASIGRTLASNGNGAASQAPGQAPGEASKAEPAAIAAARVAPPIEPAQSTLSPAALAAGAAAAAAIWTRDKDRPTVSPYVQEQPAAKAEIPVADIPVAEEQITQEHIPGLVGDLAPTKQINYLNTAPPEAERVSTPVAAAALVGADPVVERSSMPPQPQDEGAQIPTGAAPQAIATSTAETQPIAQDPNGAAVGANAEAAGQVAAQPVALADKGQPVLVQPLAPQPEPVQPGRQKPDEDEDSGLTPAGVAVLVSALASTLAGEQQRPAEEQQQQASQQPDLQAEPPVAATQAEAAGSQTIPDSAPADTPAEAPAETPAATPADTPAATPAATPADTQEAPQDLQGTVTGLDSEQNTDPAAQSWPSVTAAETHDAATAGLGPGPAEEFTGQPAAGAADSGYAPQDVTAQEQDSPLPLSAILPRAAKQAPLSKSGQAKRPEAAQASALAASGIEPEIEQVSNQLDDLIESINGLIEKTQPLLDQPPAQGQALPAEPPVAPAPFTTEPGYNAGRETGTAEDADTGVTGPYSAQNLSRMEYGLVQLLQAARRLGRDVRSAF